MGQFGRDGTSIELEQMSEHEYGLVVGGLRKQREDRWAEERAQKGGAKGKKGFFGNKGIKGDDTPSSKGKGKPLALTNGKGKNPFSKDSG